MSQTESVSKFMTDQLSHAINLLLQNQGLGSTHFLYSQENISNAVKSISKVLSVLNAPKPETPQKESKTVSPSDTKK